MHLRDSKFYANAPDEHRQQTMNLIGLRPDREAKHAELINRDESEKRGWHDALENRRNGDQFRDQDDIVQQHKEVSQLSLGQKMILRQQQREKLHRDAMWKGTKYMLMGVPTLGTILGGAMFLAQRSSPRLRALPLYVKMLPVIIPSFVASHAYADRKMMLYTERFGFHKNGPAMRSAKQAGERGRDFNWLPPLVGGLAATGMALVAQRLARPKLAGEFGTRFTQSQRLQAYRIGGQALAIGAITSFALFAAAHREDTTVHKVIFPKVSVWNRTANQPRLLMAKETGYDEDRTDYVKNAR